MDRFTEVYQSYYVKVHRFLLCLTGSAHMADELTQEVFFKALLHIDKYQEQGSMLAWLCTIGKNLWLNECKRNAGTAVLETDLPDPSPGPEESVLYLERQTALRKAILSLPEEYRDVVILHIYGGVSLKDIAAQKRKSDSWGKVTFYRAKRILMQKMEEYL